MYVIAGLDSELLMLFAINLFLLFPCRMNDLEYLQDDGLLRMESGAAF